MKLFSERTIVGGVGKRSRRKGQTGHRQQQRARQERQEVYPGPPSQGRLRLLRAAGEDLLLLLQARLLLPEGVPEGTLEGPQGGLQGHGEAAIQVRHGFHHTVKYSVSVLKWIIAYRRKKMRKKKEEEEEERELKEFKNLDVEGQHW